MARKIPVQLIQSQNEAKHNLANQVASIMILLFPRMWSYFVFQLIFYIPNCGPNQYEASHENDTILVEFAENHEILYLGVESNVFKYKLENSFINIHEVYQA